VNLKGGDPLGYLVRDGRMILKWGFRKRKGLDSTVSNSVSNTDVNGNIILNQFYRNRI
jgi:hypothetical protein